MGQANKVLNWMRESVDSKGYYWACVVIAIFAVGAIVVDLSLYRQAGNGRYVVMALGHLSTLGWGLLVLHHEQSYQYPLVKTALAWCGLIAIVAALWM